ncbi:hypothetical protein BN863_34620 [Formosa agariphila KMM 3901]|uniref:Uncharacterized protein n=1 Tax=Formosa agariphila (strain DSM 15362 / KCTC 12365 / LMG 23005 / KMM 3901 / M-2Alg 35-1) TaxID=1347342 RepID=T2KSC4_FORAG|nr:hypothetical protein [Formosa agariphila]CDF81174.1 hypothetical protein BN863_34620 [Formosa agariphila KMM 3901]
MSFTNKDLDKPQAKVAESPGFCCTANVTYNGDYYTSFTEYVPGYGPEAIAMACSAARASAQRYIDMQMSDAGGQ